MTQDVALARVLYAHCPLCESRDMATYAHADCKKHPLYKPALPSKMTWLRCIACGHIFTDGYFGGDALALLLESSHDHQTAGADAEAQRPIAARIVARVSNCLAQADGDWLDVGYGNAALLFAAEEAGFHPVGLELRRQNLVAAARLGIEVHGTAVEDHEHPGRYTVLSMSDVLEHMPFPKPALRAAHRLLKSGGCLFLSMPNAGAIAWRIANENKTNPYWAEIEHYHNFSRAQLGTLLREIGFTPVDFAVSERYRLGMEIIAVRQPPVSASA